MLSDRSAEPQVPSECRLRHLEDGLLGRAESVRPVRLNRGSVGTMGHVALFPRHLPDNCCMILTIVCMILLRGWEKIIETPKRLLRDFIARKAAEQNGLDLRTSDFGEAPHGASVVDGEKASRRLHRLYTQTISDGTCFEERRRPFGAFGADVHPHPQNHHVMCSSECACSDSADLGTDLYPSLTVCQLREGCQGCLYKILQGPSNICVNLGTW